MESALPECLAMPTTAAAAARYLTQLAGEPLGRRRLDGLLTLAQAWHLAGFHFPLFPDPVAATPAGPVVLAADPPADGELPSFRDRRFLDAMWDEYRRFSADGLHDLIVGQPPWPDLSPAVLGRLVRDRVELRLFNPAEWEAVTAGEEDIEAGRYLPAAEVFARLRSRCATT
jgi:hypothetical protein